MELDIGLITAHEFGEFFMRDFNEKLARFNGSEHLLTERLVFDFSGKIFGCFKVHVGIEECAAHLFQGFSHVHLGDLALTFQYFKGSVKTVL